MTAIQLPLPLTTTAPTTPPSSPSKSLRLSYTRAHDLSDARITIASECACPAVCGGCGELVDPATAGTAGERRPDAQGRTWVWHCACWDDVNVCAGRCVSNARRRVRNRLAAAFADVERVKLEVRPGNADCQGRPRSKVFLAPEPTAVMAWVRSQTYARVGVVLEVTEDRITLGNYVLWFGTRS